jgi:hypothetical protein
MMPKHVVKSKMVQDELSGPWLTDAGPNLLAKDMQEGFALAEMMPTVVLNANQKDSFLVELGT